MRKMNQFWIQDNGIEAMKFKILSASKIISYQISNLMNTVFQGQIHSNYKTISKMGIRKSPKVSVKGNQEINQDMNTAIKTDQVNSYHKWWMERNNTMINLLKTITTIISSMEARTWTVVSKVIISILIKIILTWKIHSTGHQIITTKVNRDMIRDLILYRIVHLNLEVGIM